MKIKKIEWYTESKVRAYDFSFHNYIYIYIVIFKQ